MPVSHLIAITTRVTASLLQRTSLLLHWCICEWVLCLMRGNKYVHSHQPKKQLLLCASLIPAAQAGSFDLRVNTYFRVNLTCLTTCWRTNHNRSPCFTAGKKETETCCQFVNCLKHFFKKTSWWCSLLAHSGHLSTSLNSKWKHDRWHQSLWKACQGCSPLQLAVSAPPDTSQVMMEML